MAKIITLEHLEKTMSYAAYRDLIYSLLIERKTTGPQQTRERVQNTRINSGRMGLIEKKAVLLPELLEELKNIRENQIWVGLAEAWCGDVAQHIPLFSKLAVSVHRVELRLLLRDENPEVMDAYLTDGSRSIPKIIALKKDTLEELWSWGPRPEPAQKLFFDMRKNGEPLPAIEVAVQKWYDQDNNQTLQLEILKKVRSVKK